MIYPNGHIDYLLYENGGALIGVAKVTMPPIKYKTVTATGAALMGDVTIPLASIIEAMNINIEFSSVADAIVQLGRREPTERRRVRFLDCREVSDRKENKQRGTEAVFF